MSCDHCENPPQHTLRAKTAPGQWQMLAKCCDECLPTAVTDARETIEDKNSLQCVPFARRDWPTTLRPS
jgi:hypothetical protein